MDKQKRTSFDLFGIPKSWIPWRSEPANVSTYFWMPDNSCRVCYECDAEFNFFIRRHHCRLCGRIFCAKCTSNTVPVLPDGSRNTHEERHRIRACNFCYERWKLGVDAIDEGERDDSHDPAASSSSVSSSSIKSSDTAHCSSNALGSWSFPVGHCKQISENTCLAVMETQGVGSGQSNNPVAEFDVRSLNPFVLVANRSDDEYDEDYGVHESDPESQPAPIASEYYSWIEFDKVHNAYELCNLHLEGEQSDLTGLSSSTFQDSFDSKDMYVAQETNKKEDHQDIADDCEASSCLCAAEDVDMEPVDFENNGLLWLPPEPENEEDECEELLLDDVDTDLDGAGEWGPLRPSGSFGSSDHEGNDRPVEEHKKAMKNVVDGHFRTLVSQLLQVENILTTDDSGRESWLEIIISLSWEAASLLKPDTSRGGGMDPGGYVKVKCIASGSRMESMVVKGIVCKKNVAHRRMATRIGKPRIMVLGGALEYQRVTNHLSSFDTLLQQEMDHLKMAVAKIDAHHPNILLVEKSVSRYAQQYILEKDISLVLKIKRPLLDRIARCTGAQIVPSVDHLSSQKMGNCDLFHVEKHLEEHVSSSLGGKRLPKTLMYFEGCPKPYGCTILLRGANVDELKKVKSVVQYGVFAAYHLGLETSFLADEGASLPELPLKEPITVTLPNKSLNIDRSISTVLGLTSSDAKKVQPSGVPPIQNTEFIKAVSLPVLSLPQDAPATMSSCGKSAFSSVPLPENFVSEAYQKSISYMGSLDANKQLYEPSDGYAYVVHNAEAKTLNHQLSDDFEPAQPREQDVIYRAVENATIATVSGEALAFECPSMPEDGKNLQNEAISSKEEVPPSSSDHQRILVSLSSRCVWKGTVCERSHLFRIKYYGNLDKPLGRFLQDHLFDPTYRCRSCEMPSEAHVQCYTHRQGTLTISVKKLQEILLPGEREGKIWMWHRCLRCPRTNGFPSATRRVVMSDAAWGLSFGKFLELSFSNHGAASRVASCGHSLHRDCLRFYGSGKMVACFHYASIDVHSVYLPPPKIDFSYEIQDWIQREADEVVKRAHVLFSKVLNALTQMAEKRTGGLLSSSVKFPESRLHIAELERVLEDEKTQFEEMLRKILNRELSKGQPVTDILDINRLRRQLLFQSYVWDIRLVSAATLDSNSFLGSPVGSSFDTKEKTYKNHETVATDMLIRPNKSMDDKKSLNLGANGGESLNLEEVFASQFEMADKIGKASPDLNYAKDDQVSWTCGRSDPLECGTTVWRTLSGREFSFMTNLSDTLDAAWTGKSQLGTGISKDNSFQFLGSFSVASSLTDAAERLATENQGEGWCPVKLSPSISPSVSTTSKGVDNMKDTTSWYGMPFLNFYRSLNKDFLGSGHKLDTVSGYNPVYVHSFHELDLQSGARLLLPVGINETIIPIYLDEPTSIISHALMSPDYHLQLSDEGERPREASEPASSSPLHDSVSFHAFHSSDDPLYRSFGSTEDVMLSISASLGSDPPLYAKAMHARVSFSDHSPVDKVKYTVTCYHAKQFDALRKRCCPCELDFVRSLSRCKKWGAQGGKSSVFFAKTLDDRFIVKQVTRTELESFIKFAPEYFKYLTESICSKSPTCLAKILGLYQVVTKQLKGGKESKMDVLVMENLLFGRKVTRLYDLKGSLRSRYNPDTSGSNKVLLDQNLIETMPTSPIFVGNKAKRLLERAVWNDTAFLASVDVMDYSLLVGVDEEKHELVLGIIDFMRQYTWDKHLETWVKASGILGGPKNESPTVISPMQYKKRFRKAMTAYFLLVPDQWSPHDNPITTSKSQSDLCEENNIRPAAAAAGASAE